jgi:hypothetical protein
LASQPASKSFVSSSLHSWEASASALTAKATCRQARAQQHVHSSVDGELADYVHLSLCCCWFKTAAW